MPAMNARASSTRSPIDPEDSASPEAQPREAAVDACLVRRFLAGDESAFTEIVNRYRGRIYGLTLNLLRNASDAEEITQDAFIRAYRGLGRFRGDSSLSTWLYRIALNLARNRYWYFFRRRRHNWVSLERPLGDDSQATFADMVAAQDHDPAQETVASEFSALVAACMERLDHKHREILTMRNVLDLSYEQIAQSLGINVGTVKSRIARARENLRTLLTEANPELEPALSVADFFLTTRT
ncbi:MAG: sigma-70 family RNA polymerase sigma factor, partial [Acidobacteriia bacterium]|nr:sigma-70 family RNA polymerase sigma factor [Terriglobia bacterium]